MLAALVDIDALWHLTAYAFAAGLGLVVAFSLGVYASDQFGDDHARGPARAAGWGAVIALAGLLCLAILVLGIWAMTQK
jgi:hypothetical protein